MNVELTKLGIGPFFTQQLTAEEIEAGQLARIIEVQRSQMIASDGADEYVTTLGGSWFQLPAEQRPTVGDWVLLDRNRSRIERLLERKSVFKRIAAGDKVDVQLIAANVDTLFIVSSCNDDFNESRLERYLALAIEAGVDPVLVLTKADLTSDTHAYQERARTVSGRLPVEVVNALDAKSLQGVAAWVSPRSTAALVGSSGVGKSTIVNSLSGQQLMNTGAIREKDGKGRHTTSYRALHLMPGGGILLDVPGMRELKLAQVDSALPEIFADIESIAQRCRFGDCGHNQEPGCAVRSAIGAGTLDERRLVSYRKLQREEARNTSSLAEQRHRDKKFGKVFKQILEQKNRNRNAPD